MALLNDAEQIELTELGRRMFGGDADGISAVELERWEALRAARAVSAVEETPESAVLEASDSDGVDEEPEHVARPRLPWTWGALGAGAAFIVAAVMLFLGGSFHPRPFQVVAPQPFDPALLAQKIPSGYAPGDFMSNMDVEQLSGSNGPFMGRAMFETEHFIVVAGEGHDGSTCMSAISRDPSAAFSDGQYACAWDPLQPQLMTYYVSGVGGERIGIRVSA